MRTVVITAMLLAATLAQAQTVVGYATVIPSKIPEELKAADTSHMVDTIFPANVQRMDAFCVMNIEQGSSKFGPLLVVKAADPKAFLDSAATSPVWSMFQFTLSGGTIVGRLNPQVAPSLYTVSDQMASVCVQKTLTPCDVPVHAVVYPATFIAAFKADKTMGTMVEASFKKEPILTEFENIKSLELQLQGTKKTFRVGLIVHAAQGSAMSEFFSQKLPWFFPAEQNMMETDKSPVYGYALSNPDAARAYWKHIKDLLDKSQMPEQARSIMALIDSAIEKNASTGYCAMTMDPMLVSKSFTSGHYTKEGLQAQLQDSVKMVSLLDADKSSSTTSSSRTAVHSQAVLSGPTQVSGLSVWKITEQTTTVSTGAQMNQYQYYALKDGNVLTCMMTEHDEPMAMQGFIESLKVAPRRPLSKEFSPFPSAACQLKINFVNCIEAGKKTVSAKEAAQMSASEALLDPEDSLNINGSFNSGAAALAFDLPMPLVKKAISFAAAGAAMANSDEGAGAYENRHARLPASNVRSSNGSAPIHAHAASSTTNAAMPYLSKFAPGSDPSAVERFAPAIQSAQRNYASSLGCPELAFGSVVAKGASVKLEFVPAGTNVDNWKRMVTVNLYTDNPQGTAEALVTMRQISQNLENGYTSGAHVLSSHEFSRQGEPGVLIDYTIGSGAQQEYAIGALVRFSKDACGFIQLQSRPTPLKQQEKTEFQAYLSIP